MKLHRLIEIVIWFAVIDLAAITVVQSAKYIARYW